jgi:histone H3/H4
MNAEDARRIDILLKSMTPNDYIMDDAACKLLFQYAEELAGSMLEQAALLATHRGESVITLTDLNLILRKKYGISNPYHPLKAPLQKDTIPVSQSKVSVSLKRNSRELNNEEQSKRKQQKK